MAKKYGFIRDRLDIKILILFIMRRLQMPITLEDLTELAMCDNGVGYFVYMDCLADLVRTEHLKLDSDMYSLTEKGERNGRITEKNLPANVKEIIESTTLTYRNKHNRASKIIALHNANADDSFTVTLSLSDGFGEFVFMELYAATREQAIEIEKGFRKNAEKIYNELIKLILEESQ